MGQRVFLLPVLVALAAWAGLPPLAAQAGDEGGASGVWVHEVRVVRVDPAAPEVSETPSVLESATGTTVRMGWPETLAALKQRGRTTVLMDQRLTTLEGLKGHAGGDRSVPILALNAKDLQNEQRRSARVRTGCKFEATVTAHLQYDLEVRWILDTPGGDNGPPELTTTWSGTHTTLDDETLVLSYREQVAQAQGKPPRAVEIYGLITGRFVRAE